VLDHEQHLTGWVTLSLADRLGSKTLRALLDHFDGDYAAIFRADSAALQRVPGVGPRIAENILALDQAEISRALDEWQAAGVHVWPAVNPHYPARLRPLADAPATLFVRGQQPTPAGRSVALVGTRQPSERAAATARQLACELAGRGYTIISGLARGVDTEAHLGALKAAGGHTLAVLGCGVLNIYPPDNLRLAEAILRTGALLSEVRPDAGPSSARLVARNRIISGLSDALIVVETGADGGAMYAARWARDQGRPVYALDYPASGNRALIDSGAIPISPDLRRLDLL
jgi:DNA processing protein